MTRNHPQCLMKAHSMLYCFNIMEELQDVLDLPIPNSCSCSVARFRRHEKLLPAVRCTYHSPVLIKNRLANLQCSSGRTSKNGGLAQGRTASIIFTSKVAARSELAEVGHEQEQGIAIALARTTTML